MDAVVTIITTIETGYFVFFSTNILFTNVWPDFYYFIIIIDRVANFMANTQHSAEKKTNKQHVFFAFIRFSSLH